MYRVLALLAISSLTAVASCQHDDGHPVPRTPPLREMLDDSAALLDPVRVDSLTLVPIAATAAALPAVDPDVLTLDEGFAQKVVAISEQAGGSVNNLTLTNKDQRPLFLLAGEVIIGGKQDRIIGQNTVIPGNTTQSVPVFCVEHGRWGGSSDEFTSGKALAHGRLRGKATFDSQQAVWNEVSAKHAARGTANATDTYRDVAAHESDGSLAAAEQRIDSALAAIDPAERARMVGYVVAINGHIATVDRFTSPRLFRKLEAKLVRSYLTESVDVAADPAARAPAATAVRAFVSDADGATREPAYESGAAATTTFRGLRAEKARVELKMSKPMAKSAKLFETYEAK